MFYDFIIEYVCSYWLKIKIDRLVWEKKSDVLGFFSVDKSGGFLIRNKCSKKALQNAVKVIL